MSSPATQVDTRAATMPKWRVRAMKEEDIDRCLDIWRQVDLTEAHHTVETFLAADPDGFYVAEIEDTGEVIGMCSGTFTRSDSAFMGFYAVDPKRQGLGIGRELWATTMKRLDDSINVGLYGVPAMSHKYKKAGFVLEDSIRMIIYESNPAEAHNLELDQLKDIDELLGCRLQLIDGNIDDSMFKKLVDYDQSVQRFSREKLLKLYLNSEDSPLMFAVIKDYSKSNVSSQSTIDPQQQHQSAHTHTMERKSSCCAKPNQESIFEDETLSTTIKSSLSISANNLGDLPPRAASPIDIPSIATHHENQISEIGRSHYEVLGYGCIRPDNTSGAMIGPIYADSSEVCEVILKNLLKGVELTPDNKFSLMALSSNKQACKLATKIGLVEIDQCTRMFTRFIPSASFSKIYYIHTPNFSLF